MKSIFSKQQRLQRSLGSRISFSYSLFLLKSLIWQIIILSIVYWVCVLGNASAVARNTARTHASNISKSEISTHCLLIDCAHVEWTIHPDETPSFFSFFDGQLMITIHAPTGAAKNSPVISVCYILRNEQTVFYAILFAWIALELICIAILLRRGERISRRALRPITEIAETARRLSASNLSERIELHGAKGELAELAEILNDMLDRIESAYNTQKQFVSDASHELRTPISVIQGYADMLDRWGKSEPEVMEESIAAIRSEATGMKELVEQLLFIARHDNQTHRYEKIYFDAGELTSEVFRDTQLLTERHQVRHGEIHRVILPGDRAALKQALRAFVDNAIKYTPAGGTITLSCRKEDNLCRITVEDTGIGVAQDELERIFERFYRTQQIGTEPVDGHGLGLSIVRIIVRAHGGRIEVESKKGVGSRFHILLPL